MAGFRTRTDVTSACLRSCGTLEGVNKPDQSGYIDFDGGREGYVQAPSKFVPVVTIQRHPKSGSGQGNLLSIRAEERFGSLLAAAGAIWAAYVATVDYANLWKVQITPPGPVEVCILGILAWLHAKYRRSIKVD